MGWNHIFQLRIRWKFVSKRNPGVNFGISFMSWLKSLSYSVNFPSPKFFTFTFSKLQVSFLLKTSFLETRFPLLIAITCAHNHTTITSKLYPSSIDQMQESWYVWKLWLITNDHWSLIFKGMCCQSSYHWLPTYFQQSCNSPMKSTCPWGNKTMAIC
jgi:hypothetical protein